MLLNVTTEETCEFYLDALHRDVVDDPDDASGPGYSQQWVARVGVVGPSTRIEVFICLFSRSVKENTTRTAPVNLKTQFCFLKEGCHYFFPSTYYKYMQLHASNNFCLSLCSSTGQTKHLGAFI